MNFPLIPLAVLVSVFVFTPSRAEVVKAADPRLPARAFPDSFTRFDPGFGPFPVRAVAGVPVPIPITFSGTTPRANDGINEHDIALRAYESTTMEQQLSRYLADEKDNFRRVGTVSWQIDLRPLASHLALLPQYRAGARDFTLILAGGSCGKSRDIKIQESSGLFYSSISTR